ncbi:hypothetical protein CS062_00420 [Roseateles chitinivorans]|uniref:Uncharacterized protein n=1 Tax=Roseateles chitinivorans TaxID=2917965 RepID=A0A2G9CFL2_9BURK|nr:hypothetical protein CS062_00420 [Roseateles chitinivorans]
MPDIETPGHAHGAAFACQAQQVLARRCLANARTAGPPFLEQRMAEQRGARLMALPDQRQPVRGERGAVGPARRRGVPKQGPLQRRIGRAVLRVVERGQQRRHRLAAGADRLVLCLRTQAGRHRTQPAMQPALGVDVVHRQPQQARHRRRRDRPVPVGPAAARRDGRLATGMGADIVVGQRQQRAR